MLNQTTCCSRRGFVKAGGAAAALTGLGYMSSRLPLAYAQGGWVTAPTSMYPVTIDGKWTNADEWTDTYEIVAPGNFWRVKHDNDYILALFDHVGDTEIDSSPDPEKCDGVGIRIDTMGNGGTKPQPDDYGFLLDWLSPDRPTLVMQQGTGTGWKDVTPLPSFSAASSMEASNDPYSAVAHLIYELQIPKSILPSNVSSVYCRLADSDIKRHAVFAWPRGSDRGNPNTWGKLEFSQNSIPEFPSMILPLTLAIGIPLYLLKRRSQRRKEVQS